MMTMNDNRDVDHDDYDILMVVIMANDNCVQVFKNQFFES